MKRLNDFFRKKYMWSITFGLALCILSTLVLLDAFVFPKAYSVVDSNKEDIQQNVNIVNADKTSDIDIVNIDKKEITDNSYKDDNVDISIEKVEKNGVVFYVADVKLSDISYLKTAFAKNTFGKNITETTSTIAKENQAIFAVNGDYYGFRDTGIIIRNGILYRDNPRKAPDNDSLIIDEEGNLKIVQEGEVTGESLIEEGVLQSFSFGPVLVNDGEIQQISTTVSKRENPRTVTKSI